MLVFVGAIFKVMHWPGAGPCLVFGGGLFALCYSPLLFLDKNKLSKTVFEKFVNVKIALLMTIIMLGFLFKAMHWPGANIGLFIGHLLLLILIPVLFIRGIKENDPVKKMNFKNESYFLILLTAFSFFIWGTTIGKETLSSIVSIEQNIHNSDSVVFKNSNISYQTIKNLKSSQLDKVEKARTLSNEMYTYIKNIKNDMLMLTEEFKDRTVLDTLPLKYLRELGNKDIPIKILFAGDLDDLSKGKARELKLKLEAFKAALNELVPEKAREGLDLGINTDSVKTENGYVQWEFNTLKTNTLIGSLTVLSTLQLNVRLAEATVVNIITSEIIKAQAYEIYKLKNPKENSKTK